MSDNDTTASRDPLATLRIDRSSTKSSAGGTKGGLGRWVAFLLVVFVLAALGWFGYQRYQSSAGSAAGWLEIPDAIKSRVEVRTVRPVVEKGRSAEAIVVATGYLESRRQAKIGARAPGRVQSVFVEEGSKVTKDQVLAVLEHADLDASLSATKASVVRSQAVIEEQRILMAQNKREWERLETLLTTRSVSIAERDQAKFQYDSSVARLESMKADVTLAEARLKEAEQLRENMFIRAPFDGTVISKDAEVGESILPGGMGEASGRGSAVTIADLDNLEVDCDVKEDYISRVVSDQAAEVSVDAVPGKRYKGIVRKVIPMGDRARATIKVKVTIVDVDSKLFPDMSATVYFLPNRDESESEVGEDQERMFIPSDAIVTSEGSDSVFAVNKDGKLEKLTIQSGKQRDNKTEILGGLKGTEKIVTKPNGLAAGQSVKVAD